jgi:hypothetical protein
VSTLDQPAGQPSTPTPPPAASVSLLRRRTRERPWLGALVFLGTFYIAALPTTYTLFDNELSNHYLSLRPYLAGLWVVFALLVGAIAGVRENYLRRTVGQLQRPAAKLVSRRREDAALNAVRALLVPGVAGLSPSFRFKAFMPNQSDRLVPAYETHVEEWQRWRRGQGAVGIKWNNPDPHTMVLLDTKAKLASVSGTLTPQQREHYGDLTMVGAQIILDEKNHPIGVLGVSCEDDSDFNSDGGVQIAGSLASHLGVLLGDLTLANA